MARRLVMMLLVGTMPAVMSLAAPGDLIVILFSNGTSSYTYGLEATMRSVADDFEVSGDTYPANGASFTLQDTDCVFPEGWHGVLQWWIHADDGTGIPGNVIATGWAPEVASSVTVDLCPSYRVLQVWFPLGREVQLTPGLRYWLALHLSWGWGWHVPPYFYVMETTTPQYSGAVFRTTVDGAWDAGWGHDLAFTVTNNSGYSYLFYDGFESADSGIWSAAVP